MNIRGMTGKSRIKLGIIQEMAEKAKYIAITETWMKEGVNDAEANIETYTIHRGDRTGKRRQGGVALYVAENYPSILKGSFSNEYAETLIVEVEREKNHSSSLQNTGSRC